MNTDFPRIITFLRKERGLSQKQVASDMGISQALLSHYEKGIRECGLDFLVKTAEYYEVSCDYLLGRTVERSTSKITVDDIPESDEISISNRANILNQINKKIINNTNSVIFDMLSQIGNKQLTNTVSNYLMCCEYNIFRRLYTAEESNSQTIFSIGSKRYQNFSNATMLLNLELIDEIIENNHLTLPLSPDVISSYFEKGASSLFNLIQYAERNIKQTTTHTGR